MKNGGFMRFLKAFTCLLPAAAALLLFFLLPFFPGFAEIAVTGGIFRLLSAPLGMLTSLLPFSLTEIAVVAAVPALILLTVLFVRHMRRSANRKRTAGRAVKAAGWTLSLLLLAYMLLHGLNFDRRPAAELMELDVSPKSAAFLQQVTGDLARLASREREGLSEDDDGCAVLSEPLDDTLSRAGEGYRALQGDYSFLWGTVNRAKPVVLSHWWSYTGITGVYFPFFNEANINRDVPASGIPATAAHELAHTRGFAREDECNFFAYLSCVSHPDAEYRYSGYLLAYTLCANALYDYDADRWREASAFCSEGMRRDIVQNNDYWKRFEGQIQQLSSAVNDSFLEAQGDPDGVLSYDRAVSLILAWYQSEELLESAD